MINVTLEKIFKRGEISIEKEINTLCVKRIIIELFNIFQIVNVCDGPCALGGSLQVLTSIDVNISISQVFPKHGHEVSLNTFSRAVEQCAKCVSRRQRHFDTYRSNENHYRRLSTRCTDANLVNEK